VTAADAVVIGAGCAGLAAATALADAGLRVAVVEARPVAGGRTFATRDRDTGTWVDNGQHVLFGCYHQTLDYLARIGTRQRLIVQSSLTVPMVDLTGRRSELRCPPLPSPWQLAAGVLAWEAVPFAERLAVRRLAPALRPGAVPAADETVRQWLVRHGQPAGLVAMLWEPLAVAALNQSIDDSTATTFVEVIRRLLGDGPDDASLVMPATSLSHLLVDPAVAHVEARRGTVVRGTPARLVVDGGRAHGVSLRDGTAIHAPAVVSAVPWHALPALFDEAPAPLQDVIRDAGTLGSAPIVTVHLWFDRDVLDAPFVGLPGRRFQWAFDARRIAGDGAHVSLVCSGADEIVALDNGALVELACRELAEALPAARAASRRRASAVRERRATFSLRAGEPRRPGTITGLPGFFLAGDWTDTGLPATIESAVLSGHRAARAVLEHL
jgi:squalene-associated FAD-dependent desaturase